MVIAVGDGDVDRDAVGDSRPIVELYTDVVADVVEWLPHPECCEPAMNIIIVYLVISVFAKRYVKIEELLWIYLREQQEARIHSKTLLHQCKPTQCCT